MYIYGCIESEMVLYKLYPSTLTDMGFKINPYDICIANKTINGKQFTIAWYVDKNKISHQDNDVVEDVLKIEGYFGKLKTTKGDRCVFLGMNMFFKKKYTLDDLQPFLINPRECTIMVANIA